MHIKCPTDKAILLVGIRDEKGILRFPTKSSHLPGLFFDVDHDVPINLQIIQAAETFLGESNLGPDLGIFQSFRGDVKLENHGYASLYLAQLTHIKDVDPTTWSTMADLLRSMPANKNRVLYMLALQVFAGGLDQQDTLVFEGEEASNLISEISKD